MRLPYVDGTREQVEARSGGLCEKCGRAARSGVFLEPVLHHRQRRAHGGTWDLGNVVLLHALCHNMHRDSVHDNPSDSYDSGHLVRSHGQPRDVPLLLGDGRRVYLTADGTYAEAPDE